MIWQGDGFAGWPQRIAPPGLPEIRTYGKCMVMGSLPVESRQNQVDWQILLPIKIALEHVKELVGGMKSSRFDLGWSQRIDRFEFLRGIDTGVYFSGLSTGMPEPKGHFANVMGRSKRQNCDRMPQHVWRNALGGQCRVCLACDSYCAA